MGTKRVALVIGNSSYNRIRRLNNAGRDAIAICSKLDDLEFDGSVRIDLDYNDMERTLKEFYAKIPGQVALLYFAGHGVQSNGSNYLLPVDADLDQKLEISNQGFSLSQILREISAKAETGLLFIDACRDRGSDATGATRGASWGGAPSNGGLAAVSEMRGTFIGFSTTLDSVADDGEPGGLSPFAKALAEHISTPSLSIDDLMLKVNNDVGVATGGRQFPFKHGGLTKPFYFRGPTHSVDDKEIVDQLSEKIRRRLGKISENVGIAIDSGDRVLVEMADTYAQYMEDLVKTFALGEFSSPRSPRIPSPRNLYARTLASMYARARQSVFSTSNADFGMTWKKSGRDIIGAHVNANVDVQRVFLIKGESAQYLDELREYQALCKELDLNRKITSYVFHLSKDYVDDKAVLKINQDYTIIDDGRFVGVSSFLNGEVEAIWYYRQDIWTAQAQNLRETYLREATELSVFLGSEKSN